MSAADEVEVAEETQVVAGSQKKTKKSGGTKGNGDRKASESMSSRAKICFPVARFKKALKQGGYAKRAGVGGAIYLTAVIEYITAEILELAGNAAKEQKKNRIIPRHIQLAIRNDEELNKYMSNVTIQGGGVIPNVHQTLMPKKDAVLKGASGAQGSFSQEY
eukprot:TRINITY_DN4254_c0_g7_i1.p1 TRINITY_DN4254_c0_g7~~TRINITY_DN4254_c0_g7_i1.p1  ORF type:complete len:162 (+),score=47.12 TRINITY_DN4254_c0_g7_i1:69-554(+)